MKRDVVLMRLHLTMKGRDKTSSNMRQGGRCRLMPVFGKLPEPLLDGLLTLTSI